MIDVDLKGTVVPVPAQFHDDLSLNLNAMEMHVEYLLEKNVKIFYLAQAASEFEWMSRKERLEVVKTITKILSGKALLLAQPVGRTDVTEHIDEALMFRDCGVDIIVIMPNPIKAEGMFFSSKYLGGSYKPERHDQYYVEYIKKIDNELNHSFIYHNFPTPSGACISFDALDEITDMSNIAALKEHNTDRGMRHKIYDRYGQKLVCYDGFAKEEFVWAWQWGSRARHSNWSWFDPEWDQKFYDAFVNEDMNKAVKMASAEWPVVKKILNTGYAGYKNFPVSLMQQRGKVTCPTKTGYV